MAVLTEKNGAFDQNLTLNSQDLTITLPTTGKFIDKNIILNLSARDGDVRIPAGSSVEVTPTLEIDSNGTVTAAISTTETITPQVHTTGWVDSSNVSGGDISIEGSAQLELGAKTSSDLTATNGTVYAPAGYYPAQASKTIASGTLQLTGGELTPGSGSVVLSSDGLYNATNGLNTADQMDITSTAPTGNDNYYQITVSGSGQVSSAAANAQITKNGYLTSSANKSIAAATVSSNTQSTPYYILKATRSVTNGDVTVTEGSVSITPSGIVTSQEDTGYSLAVSATGGSATVGASTVTVSAGYNPSTINAGSAQRSITGQSVNETTYIQAGEIAAAITSNVGGAAEMTAHGFSPLTTGTSDYYVELGTTAGTVQATASTTTEGYIKNASDTTEATSVSVSGNGDKVYLAAANLGSEGSVTTAPSVAITNSTTMQTTSSNTGFSFTVGGTPTDGTVQTKYKSTTEGYTPMRTATNGGTVSVTPSVSGATTVNIKRSTYSNTATEGVTYADVTDNSTILTSNGKLYINEGYTPNSMISLAHLIPDGANLSSNASMLAGVTAYDSNGVLYTGTIPTKTSSDITVEGKSVTTPAGYFASDVTTNVAVGAVTSPDTVATIGSPSYNSAAGNFSISASGTIAAPTVNTAGYISEDAGTRNSGSISGSTTLAKIGIQSAHSGKTAAVTPVISKQMISIEGVVDAAAGIATTTAPTGGVYVAVKSAENKGDLVSTPSVSSTGYGTTTVGQYTATTATSEVGANASATTYIPITTTSANKNGATVSYGSGWITSGSVTVDSGVYSAAVNSHTISTTPVVAGLLSGTVINIGTTSRPSGTDGVDYWTITPSSEVTTVGKSSAVGEADVTTAGWLNAGNVTSNLSEINITPSTNDGTARYIVKAGITAASTDATATTTVEPGNVTIAENTTMLEDKTRLEFAPSTLSSNVNKYYIAVKATAAANSTGATSAISGSTQASVVSAGYAPLALTGTGTVSGTATAVTSQKQSSVYYIPVPTATFTTSGNKVYCTAGGYVPQGSTSSVLGTIATGTITNNTTLGQDAISTGTINRGNYIKIGAGYYDSDRYYLAQANSGTYTVAASGTASVDGYANISVPSTSITKGITSVSSTIATRGTAAWGSGWITAGNITAASFANSASANTTYIDISNTSDAPILTGGYLYINEGYVDNLKISLAKLIPDSINDISTFAASGQILQGYVAYNSEGEGITGTIPTKSSANLSIAADGKTVQVPAGYYATAASLAVATGTYTADSASSTNSTVTPSLGLENAATLNYGFTTTKPSGTTGTDYLTLSPNAVATAWSVTPRANITTAGYLAATSKSGEAVTNTPSIDSGIKYYIPVITPTFNGGALSASTNTNVVATTPVVTVSSSGTFKTKTGFGVTTTQPAGTDGTNYLTIEGSGAVTTTGKATSTVKVARADITYSNAPGAIQVHTNTVAVSGTDSGNITKDVNITPSITDNFSALYIPVVSASFSGGEATINNYSKNDLAVTLASGSETNMTNAMIGSKNTTTYPYYFKINGSTPAISTNTSVVITDVKYSNDAGAITAHTNANAKTMGTYSPTVSVNAASGSTYISLKQASMTVAGTNTVTPTASVAGATDVVLMNATNNGIAVTATGGGTASVTATATTNVAGFAPASTQLGSATLAAASNTTTATQYIYQINVPTGKAFTITTVANSVVDNNVLTVSNGAYRTVELTNAANGVATITNSGTATITNSGTASITNNDTLTVSNSANKTATITNSGTVNTTNNGTASLTNNSGKTATITNSGAAIVTNSDGTVVITQNSSASGSGVTITTPESGTRSFSITVPNGENDTATFVFTVDSTGDVTVDTPIVVEPEEQQEE